MLENLALEILKRNNLTPNEVIIENCTIVGFNKDNTANIVTKGVPIFELPTQRKQVGNAKLMRTKDGRKFLL